MGLVKEISLKVVFEFRRQRRLLPYEPQQFLLNLSRGHVGQEQMSRGEGGM